MDAGTYMEYGVSIGTLRGFLKGIRRELLEHNFCDLAFTRYLREGHELPMCRLQLEGIPWLYFCRRDPGIGQLCVSLRGEVFCRGLQNNAELDRLCYSGVAETSRGASGSERATRRGWSTTGGIGGMRRGRVRMGEVREKVRGGGREEGGEDVDEDADGTACHI